jgi:hypothetical protein
MSLVCNAGTNSDLRSDPKFVLLHANLIVLRQIARTAHLPQQDNCLSGEQSAHLLQLHNHPGISVPKQQLCPSNSSSTHA